LRAAAAAVSIFAAANVKWEVDFFSLAKSPHGEQREKEKMPSTS
jgi:hypothetical protein